MLRIAGLICLLVASAVGGESRWNPVEPDLLTLKEPRVDRDAPAEMVFKRILIEEMGESGNVRLSIYVRLKLYTAAGAQDWSIVSLMQGPSASYKDIAARTTAPDGMIYELGKADIVEHKIVKGLRRGLTARSFAVPMAQPGSVVEYRYTQMLKDADYVVLDTQEDIPIWHFSVTFPAAQDVRWYANQRGLRREATKDGRIRAIQENVAGFREEPMMPPLSRARGVLVVRRHHVYAGLVTWDAMGTVLYGEFEESTRPGKAIKALAAELTAGITEDKAKLAALDGYCRTKIQNLKNAGTTIGIRGLKAWKAAGSPEQTLERRIGTGTEINYLFAALARAAGFEVNPIAIGDREGPPAGKDDPLMARFLFSARSIAVKLGKDWRVYDPATPFLAAGTMRWQEQGALGVVFGPTLTTFVETEPAPSLTSRVTRQGDFTLEENGTLKGHADLEYAGHPAVRRRTELSRLSAEKQKEFILDEVRTACPGGQWAVEKVENLENAEFPLKVRISLDCPEFATGTGKRLLVQPAVFQHNRAAPFTEAKRTHPIWIPYGWTETDSVIIRYPEGYMIESPSAPRNLMFKPVGSYEVVLANDAKRLQLGYTRRYEFGTQGGGEVSVQHYEALKEVFDAVHAEDSAVVSLARALVQSTKVEGRP